MYGIQDFTPARRWLVSAVPVMLLLVIGVTTVAALNRFLFMRERVWESRTTFEAAESLRRTLAGAHVANHEYLLSGEGADLVAYRAAAKHVGRSMELLTARTTSDPDLAIPAARLADLARVELNALDRAADRRAAGEPASAAAIARTPAHRATEVIVGQRADEIEKVILSRVRSDRARERVAVRWAYAVLALGVLAGGLVVGLLRWVLLGYARAQAAAAAEQVRARREVDQLLAAERIARERVERLQALTDALARAVTPEDVVEATTALAGVTVGSRTCALMLLDDSATMFTLVPGAGYSPEAAIAWHRFPNSPGTSAEEAVRTGRPAYCRTRAEYAALGPHLDELARMLGLESLATMPLTIAERDGTRRMLGALTFIFGTPRTFEEDEPFLLAVAGQCALALDRARLYEAERGERRLAEAALAERTEAERALRESEERFRTLADNIPQLAWMTDGSGRAIWRNSRMYEYTGMNAASDTGSFTPSVHHPEHFERVRSGFLRALQTGEAWEDTFPLRGAEGGFRWFLTRAVPLRDSAGRIFRWFGTNTDITDQLQAEASLRLAKEEAEHANRAKSEFLAAMSHELRTPLNAIGGYVELLEIGIHGPVTEPQLASLERIRVNGKHLLALINDILSYAKLEAGRITYEIRELNVRDTLDALEPLVAPQIQAKGLIYTPGACDPSLCVMGDTERVRQILLNLIANATKFTDAGGRIELSSVADEQRVHLRVSDTGHGIDGDRLERIFEPFVQLERSRVDSSQQGVGLGLAISRDLARGMGGDVSVVSVPGAGSTFTLTLPRSADGVDARLASGERRRGGDRRGVRPDRPRPHSA